jgi:peroxiredoxin
MQPFQQRQQRAGYQVQRYADHRKKNDFHYYSPRCLRRRWCIKPGDKTMTCSRKNGWWNWLPGTLLCTTLVLVGCGEQRFGAKEAPEFTLPLLAGGEELSLQDYRGDVIYLTFWASWCIPCRQEMPYLAQLWQRHHEAGLQVIGINVEEDLATAQQFARELELPFLLVHDQHRTVSKLYRVPGFPTHYVIDRKGKIRFSGLGFNLADAAAVSQEVETLLQESGDATD